MLVEFLQQHPQTANTKWLQVMPGIEVHQFRMDQSDRHLPILLQPQLKSHQFEVLFCCRGIMELKAFPNQEIQLKAQEVLMLSDAARFESVQITSPLEGVLVSVDARTIQSSLHQLSSLLGELQLDIELIHRRLAERNSFLLLREIPWVHAMFGVLEDSPDLKQGSYCAWKTLELMYLFSSRSNLLEQVVKQISTSSYLTRIVANIHAYMLQHLDEKLTIAAISRQFCISPTAFKECFRRLYGQPVHSWLQEQRIQRAAMLLRTSSISILETAQSVGYSGVSQFNVAFKSRYGVSPGKYRKMSETVEI